MRSENLRKRPLLALFALAAGCSYDWDSLRPNGSVATPDVITDTPRVDATDGARTDAPGDGVTPDVAVDTPVVDAAPDVTQPDAPSIDAADVSDASDVADASDALDVMDVRDASDVSDVTDALDVMDVRDVIDVTDVPVDTAPPDVGPPDTGPVCSGPAAMCPCSATNTAGYCRPGEACTAGACVAGAVAGSLLITEIMNDPATPVTDEYGEWFEVYNPGATPLDLRGMRISNSRAHSTSITSTSPVVIAPRAYAVLGRSAMSNGGVTPLYAYGVTLMMNVLTFANPTSSDAVILDMGSMVTEIDRVLYDGATTSLWPRTSGKSKNLRPTALTITENDLPANWCNAPTQWVSGSGGFGSPGVANPACP